MFFSFWGKFGQRNNMAQSKIVSDLAEFHQLFTDSTRELVDWHVLSDDLVQLEWKHKKGYIPENLQTNIFLATFTTAHARLRLYDVLEKLDQQVLYFDTDSVVFKYKEGDYRPQTGDFLGDLTDELNGEYIVEFVSAGPKNYAYRLSNGSCYCKVKGFTLNHKNSQKINFQAMCNEVFLWYFQGLSSGLSVHNPRKICRNAKEQNIFNREENKKYSVVYDKRRVLSNMDTLPYGF